MHKTSLRVVWGGQLKLVFLIKMCGSSRSEIDHQAVVISARIPSTRGLYSSFGVICLFHADYCQSLTNTANYKINIDKIHLYRKMPKHNCVKPFCSLFVDFLYG